MDPTPLAPLDPHTLLDPLACQHDHALLFPGLPFTPPLPAAAAPLPCRYGMVTERPSGSSAAPAGGVLHRPWDAIPDLLPTNKLELQVGEALPNRTDYVTD